MVLHSVFLITFSKHLQLTIWRAPVEYLSPYSRYEVHDVHDGHAALQWTNYCRIKRSDERLYSTDIANYLTA